tara:strand:+ start:3793 stop:4308 length:516 start_codon:yes stop_codon:yes gene_type:complete
MQTICIRLKRDKALIRVFSSLLFFSIISQACASDLDETNFVFPNLSQDKSEKYIKMGQRGTKQLNSFLRNQPNKHNFIPENMDIPILKTKLKPTLLLLRAARGLEAVDKTSLALHYYGQALKALAYFEKSSTEFPVCNKTISKEFWDDNQADISAYRETIIKKKAELENSL